MTDTILIANRGEIAARIIRSAAACGARTVAVYTDADRDAPHVSLADMAVRIGDGPVGTSYLAAETLLDAARSSCATMVHPGYGFLSENADFARACADAGLVFIGPPAAAIAAMGNKAAAKRMMAAAGVPVVPGYDGADQSDAALKREAARIGYPLMIKAAAGGGGRGMRRVDTARGFADALALARAEAASAFGSDEMILERAVTDARHVEVQVFADTHGNIIHLGERDCSVQRRHQKVIEEAPSPAVDEALRAEMGAAAVAAARAVDYVGAGTVEFLLAADGAFCFLEMNTRLQVEHPVTEMVTGLDLVALQIRVAQGAPLGLAQGDVALTGHAIEARLYAEDPEAGFLPQTGTLHGWRMPQGAGLRVDDGVREGQAVSPHYDPMLAKIIAHGADRAEARARLIAALSEVAVAGVRTNRDFLIDLLDKPAFADGSATTSFLDTAYADGVQPGLSGTDAVAAAVCWFDAEAARTAGAASHGELAGWSSTGRSRTPMRLNINGEPYEFMVETTRGTRSIHGAAQSHQIQGSGRNLRLDGASAGIVATIAVPGGLTVVTTRRTLDVSPRSAVAGTSATSGQVIAPMPGNVVSVAVKPGDRVAAGDRIAVIEAMKMQHGLDAGIAGKVVAVHAEAGNQVTGGALVAEIEPEEAR